MSTNFVPPSSSSNFSAPAGFASASPFLATQQPESLIPQGAVPSQPSTQVFQPASTPQQAPVSPSSPFPTVEQQGESKPKSMAYVLTPEDIQKMNLEVIDGGQRFMISGRATIYWRKHFHEIQDSSFTAGKNFTAWLFPVTSKSAVESLLSKIKSGELPPSSQEELEQEMKEIKKKKYEKFNEKKKARKNGGKKTKGKAQRNQQGFPMTQSNPMGMTQQGFQGIPQQMDFSMGQQGFQQGNMGFGMQQGFPQQGFGMQQGFPQQGFPMGQQQGMFNMNTPSFGIQQPGFGGQQQTLREAKHKIVGDFQLLTFKLFRPQVGYGVKFHMNGATLMGRVEVANQNHDGTITTCDVRRQDGALSRIHVVNDKWRIVGLQADHGIYFQAS